MKNRIMKKLRSNSGASITFALLLFLVCAVLCSVIIAAATAAAGRISKLTQTDQRYYAVQSAAELMKDTFDRQTVIIEKTYQGTKTEDYTSGDVINSPSYDSDYTLAIKSGDTTVTDFSGFNSLLIDAAYKYSQIVESGAANLPENLKIKSSSSLLGSLGVDEENDPLMVTITEVVDRDGKVTMTIYNTYNLKIVFSAVVISTVSETEGTRTESGNIVTVNMTKVEATSITWTISEISTNS